MEIKDHKHVYFVGIGGIGVSAIARLILAMGKKVSGSDLRSSTVTDNLSALGAVVYIGHHPDNLKDLPDLVIHSEDVSIGSKGYVEVQFAVDHNIEVMTYSQALGRLMEGQYGIGVSGTNGKSTTTALLGLILEKAGFDPSVVVGSQISPKNSSPKFATNARLGAGRYFVAEADEYHRHMLDSRPQMIVITNIAEDHLDYYKDIDEIKTAFTEYITRLPKDGIVIYNADDHNAVEVCRHATCHKLTFGIHHYGDLQALNLEVSAGEQSFDLHLNDNLIGRFEFHMPGKFNVSNALGAVSAAIKLGVKPEIIKEVLKDFAGIWRRFEKVGELQGKTIISDYGHHPAGVAGTIEAAKEFYPGKKILIVFQPHHRNRTKKLFKDFVDALIHADEVIVPEIFDVAGREHGEDISSRQIVEELVKLNVKATFCPDLNETGKLIQEKISQFDVAILMGAGDIDLLARKLVTGNA
jgi:UDP-N-acetylmuramate--alanine ligase